MPWEANVNSEYDNRSYSVFTIADIITSKEKVEFIEYTGSPFKNKINQINIYNILNYSLMKRIQFYYSDQYAYPNNYIFLDSVKIFSGDLVEFQVHNLKYYNRNLLPNTYLVPDQWGYNKFETSINRLFHNEFKTDSMGAVGSDCHPFNPRSGTLGNKGGYFSDRTVNFNP